ncbi:RNA polymerase II C-terminal domain phosphatase-like 1 isoform X2 [Rhodamnia argentea]|uniref:protein-serine/threonine phosphatase n=1 Tax=Rhodamnia argentea TaxID=178133 RepID=A0A8B8Q8Q0_9MYRT|nr:RNA polymerase II C-terminal domain phosphatase-like 1 isoform X2 [Rhodamnia argentea]
MYKSVVFHGEELLGEVEIYLQQLNRDGGEEESCYQSRKEKAKMVENVVKERVRIDHLSLPSERCPPLAVLHTVAASGICFKMESKSSLSRDSALSLLHSSCTRDSKTAVMPLGEEELHLVAMYSRNGDGRHPCFWGFCVPSGLYSSCLVMLNLRCLGIVFDLDETLIVANTMRSFEDRIEALQRKINTESDPQRISGMIAEVKRYQDDKTILKQYVDNDQVVENGKVIKVQYESVPALSDNTPPFVRPLIRLPEKNIILTRINPLIRDTSVLVRLRPAWEELRSYLTARGRKRFEVYVCTMAERDYALEMWRLLDPESNLIQSKEVLERIVCVKSGSRKSLFDVFQNGICHPKMALVIDDRLKVWDEKDQPRVHVVPAFAPYYAPQAEANSAVPVLCVARNVACNVRGGFFKEFDEGLLQRISEVAYEDDTRDIPSPPDVSNYLVSEDDTSALNGNKDPLSSDGMAGAEVERTLKDVIPASIVSSAITNLDPRILVSLQNALASSASTIPLSTSQTTASAFPNMQFPEATSLVKKFGQASPAEQSMQSSPAREEGEVPESELDPDTRRRLLILQHGQDNRDQVPGDPPFPVRPPIQVSAPRAQSHGTWFPVEEEMSPRRLTRSVPKEYPLDSEMHIDKHRPHHPSLFPNVENSIPPERTVHESHRLPKEGHGRDDRLKLNYSFSTYHSISGEENSLSRTSTTGRDFDSESGRPIPTREAPAVVLQEIAMKCGAKVEFRQALLPSMDLQFSIEAWFAGEQVGKGIGRTRREAQHEAAEGSLRHLADMYMMKRAKSDPASRQADGNRLSPASENGYFGSVYSFGNQPLPKEDPVPYATTVEPSRFPDPRFEGPKNSMGSVSALKELCMMEGLGVVFQAPPHLTTNAMQNKEVHVEVKIEGQVLGTGIGLTWDEAEIQAAERALGSLRPMLGQLTPKRPGSPRLLQGIPSKRLKSDFPRVLPRMPSSARYPKNAPAVP